MSNKEFLCPKCNQKGFPIQINYKSKNSIYKIIMKCPDHKVKFEISENDLKDYLPDLIKNTLICRSCGKISSHIGEIMSYLTCLQRNQSILNVIRFCTECGKGSIYKIVSFLSTPYHDFYFDILKSNANNELLDIDKKVFLCSECNEHIIVKKIYPEMREKKILLKIEGKCSGPEHHEIMANLPMKNLYNWLTLLPKSINRCENCNSKDLIIKNLNFKFPATHWLTTFREITQICRNCGHENKSELSHHLYEFYRRILKEKEVKAQESLRIICKKCQSDAIINELKVKRKEIQIKLLCKLKHKTNLNIEQDKIILWMDSIISGVNTCKFCWSANQKIIRLEHIQAWISLGIINKSKFTFRCLDCNKKRDIVVDNLIYDEIMDYLALKFKS